VPITINGSYDVLRIGSLNVRPHRMEMVIHDSIHIPDDMDANHKNLQCIADKVQEVVASDLWDKYK
jgi:1-acyl-sn-glycerol-3-phosphate acyltransferase